MISYIFRRLLILIPMLLVITFSVFFLMKLAPGDFLDEARAQRDISKEYIAQLEKEYGVKEPWYVQYSLWLKKAVTLDFGYSWTYKVSVSEMLAQRVPATLALALSSMLLAWAIAIPLGVLSAIYKDSIFDRISAFLAYAAISIPEFFLALLAVYLAATTGLFPTGGITSILHDFMSPPEALADYFYHLILPTLVLGLGGVAGSMRIMRANFLDTIRSEFVTTARAKGLPEGVVMFKHVLRNAINPLVTSLGFAVSSLLSGALMVENIMNYPGLGQLTFNAFMKRDQYLVLGSVVMGVVLLVLGNLLADILLAASDPRIRLEKPSSSSQSRSVFAVILATLAPVVICLGIGWIPWSNPVAQIFLKGSLLVLVTFTIVFVLVIGYKLACRFLLPVLQRKDGLAAMLVLTFLYLAAIFAPALAPYKVSDQNLKTSYHPPTALLWKDGRIQVQVYKNVDPLVASYQPDPGNTVPLQWLVKVEPYKLLGFIPLNHKLFQVDPEHRIYLLGSDATGRDVFSRLLFGAQISLSIGLIGITVTMALGFLVGGLAGYYGGTFDNLAMRLVEVLMAVPGLYLLLALRSALAQHFDSAQMFFLIIIILSFIGWTSAARVIRGMTLSLRSSSYVLAAESMGQSSIRILIKHVLPNIAGYLLVAATLSIPGYILGEAALSFLNIGIQEPSASWGLMLSQAQEMKVFMLDFWWLLLPGAAIFITVIAFNVLGDVLRDIVDPRFRLQGKS